MSPRLTTIALLLLLAAAAPLDAQRRRGRWMEPIPSWGIEPTYGHSILKDDPISLAGGRIGRQLDETLNLGVSGAMMLTPSAETQRSDGYERITSLIYLGPSIELRDSVRGRFSFLLRASAAVGLAGFEESWGGVEREGTAFVFGVAPEVGVLIRLSRAIQFTSTVGLFHGWRYDGGNNVVTGPTAAAGIRVIK